MFVVKPILMLDIHHDSCVCVCKYNCCTGVKSSEEFAFVTEEDLSKRRRVRNTSDPELSCTAGHTVGTHGSVHPLMCHCSLESMKNRCTVHS